MLQLFVETNQTCHFLPPLLFHSQSFLSGPLCCTSYEFFKYISLYFYFIYFELILICQLLVAKFKQEHLAFDGFFPNKTQMDESYNIFSESMHLNYTFDSSATVHTPVRFLYQKKIACFFLSSNYYGFFSLIQR